MATKKKDKSPIGLCVICGADVFRGTRCELCRLGFVADDPSLNQSIEIERRNASK